MLFRDLKVELFANLTCIFFPSDFPLPEEELHDDHWHHMCFKGAIFIGNWSLYIDGILTLEITGYPSNIPIQRGSILRIGVLSNESIYRESELMGELSQFNIWDKLSTSDEIFMMSRGCHAKIGNVIPWSGVQLWLSINVTKTTPTSCTGAGTCNSVFFSLLLWFLFLCNVK